mmetsp:Transcript_663/g.2115  ORF Transcript_663/g.2115 Transcript_663/m.2115 type:complete len:202 (-) Transcript_663:91-696(-)
MQSPSSSRQGLLGLTGPVWRRCSSAATSEPDHLCPQAPGSPRTSSTAACTSALCTLWTPRRATSCSSGPNRPARPAPCCQWYCCMTPSRRSPHTALLARRRTAAARPPWRPRRGRATRPPRPRRSRGEETPSARRSGGSASPSSWRGAEGKTCWCSVACAASRPTMRGRSRARTRSCSAGLRSCWPVCDVRAGDDVAWVRV